MPDPCADRLRERALDELGARDSEAGRVLPMNYEQTQRFKARDYDAILDMVTQAQTRTQRGLWLVVLTIPGLLVAEVALELVLGGPSAAGAQELLSVVALPLIGSLFVIYFVATIYPPRITALANARLLLTMAREAEAEDAEAEDAEDAEAATEPAATS